MRTPWKRSLGIQGKQEWLSRDPSLSADALIAWCKERLAAYKYPRIVEFSDSLPKGPTGKILKRELKR
jgi:long-chain acyl-CoA synthetase